MFTHADLPRSIRDLIGAVRQLHYPAGQGATSTVVFATTDRGVFVIKRAEGEQFVGWLAQEWHVLHALARSDLPVPRAIHFEHDGSDQAWLVMSRLPGVPLREALEQTRDRAKRERLLHNWGAALAAIHRTVAPPELTDQTSWLDRVLAQAEYNLIRYEVDGSPELLAQLQADRPAPITPTLIHGDWTLDNTLVTDQMVAGVIDWAGGTLGDPRYDLALAMDDLPDPTDQIVFRQGYGERSLSPDEQRYFVDLYEFF